ncbi:hypothetical protein ACHAWX_002591 [Stephanocyclus meneghinianus]
MKFLSVVIPSLGVYSYLGTPNVQATSTCFTTNAQLKSAITDYYYKPIRPVENL